MTPFQIVKADDREVLMNKVLKIMISNVNDIIDDKGLNQIKKCIKDIY